jgi:hypothetical protein
MYVVFVGLDNLDSEIRLVGYVYQYVFQARGKIADKKFPPILAYEDDVILQQKL